MEKIEPMKTDHLQSNKKSRHLKKAKEKYLSNPAYLIPINEFVICGCPLSTDIDLALVVKTRKEIEDFKSNKAKIREGICETCIKS